MAQETDLGLGEVDALSGFKQLDDSLVALDLEDLAAALFAAGKLYLGQLVVGYAVDVLDDHQGAGDLSYGLILFNHASSPPSTTAPISCFISAT